MRSMSNRLLIGFVAAAMMICSCGEDDKSTTPNNPVGPGGGGEDDPNVTLVVTSISGRGGWATDRQDAGMGQVLETPDPPPFTHPTHFQAGYINAGPPEYLKLTITRIEIDGDFGHAVLWEGEKELLVDGSNVDVGDMSESFNRIQPGTATRIRTSFRSMAKVKGSLTADFNTSPGGFTTDPLTVYTKAAHPYDAVSHTGGADSYEAFTTGPAEETDFWLGGDGAEFAVETPCNETIGDSTTTQLTILIDLNRLLRFYNGISRTQGPNPADLHDQAYFFGHSLLGGFVAPFFGAPGTIEGYKTFYSSDHPPTNEGVQGWMTLVYDASGNVISGMLTGDDDNALTVSKGRVLSFTGEDGDRYTFTYDTAQGTVTGFERVATIGSYSAIANWVTTHALGANAGEACFQLFLRR